MLGGVFPPNVGAMCHLKQMQKPSETLNEFARHAISCTIFSVFSGGCRELDEAWRPDVVHHCLV